MVTLFAQFFDKRGAFDFNIVNFPDLSGNIPAAPAYVTYISQLIRYSRACHNYDNFSCRHSMLAERLFSQGFSARKLMRTFYQRTCDANAAGENSSFIFTVCVNSVPHYHFKLAYVVLQMAGKEFFETHF